MDQTGSRPISDPSELTTQNLKAESAHLEKFLLSELSSLREVEMEKFAGVQKQFEAVSTAVEKAFNAQEKMAQQQFEALVASINKSVTAINKQIDSSNEKTDLLRDDFNAIKNQMIGRKDLWGALLTAIIVLIGVLKFLGR